MSALIYQQIPKVMKDIGAVSKSRTNVQQGFKFRGIDDVVNEVSAKLSQYGLFVVPEVINQVREERATKSGGILNYSIMHIKYTMYAEDGSSISAVMIGEGSDSGDKASNKAQSVALKYFFLQLLAIPTEDSKDPDEESHEFADRKPAAPKPKVEQKNPLKEVKEAQKVASTNPASYVCTFGKYKGQCVGDIDIFELNNYCDYIIGEAEKSQKSIQGKVKEFLEAAESFLKSREPNQQMADSDCDAV